jgi:hypothetical protein
MSSTLELSYPHPGAITVCRSGGQPLFRYVFQPETPAREASRPFLHPLYSLAGDVLTNSRPNDHPWHHGLSLTLTSVDGVNFWGGPSYRSSEGYAWHEDHGTQRHQEWLRQEPEILKHTLEWCEVRTGRAFLTETRTLRVSVASSVEWSLEWISLLRNAAGYDFALDNYHSREGLAGSHYTGLQFRGARGFLDEHGDPRIAIVAEGGREGEQAVHGQDAQWVEWHGQHDGSLRRTRVRFENLGGTIPWFVRRAAPLIAFAPHRERSIVLPAESSLLLAHRLTFSCV